MHAPLLASLLTAFSLLHATASAAEGAAEPPSLVKQLPPAPGTVVSESSRDLGHGFRDVSRSQVNGPGSFEGMGHFSFLYYRSRQLCRCAGLDYAIAPSGQFAVFVDGPSGKLKLFHAPSGQLRELTKHFMGTPQTFTWDEARGTVKVLFLPNEGNGHPSAKPMLVRLR